MRRSLRDTVRARAHFRCGYCGVSEPDVGAKMTVDHFQPLSQGGDDSGDNLVYSCHACNEFKGDYWRTEPHLRLLHPRLDAMAEHWREENDTTLTIDMPVIGALRILVTALRTAHARTPVWLAGLSEQRLEYRIPTDSIPISVEK